MPELKIVHIKLRDRQRKDMGDIISLSESIKRIGLIQPIIVEERDDGTYTLLAGERRLRASLLAGLSTIPVIFREDLLPLQRLELELEENLHRKNLTWVEECEAKLRIDDLKRELYGSGERGRGTDTGGWTNKKLALELDQSLGGMVQDLYIGKKLRTKTPEQRKDLAKIPKTAALRKMKAEDQEQAAMSRIKGKLIEPSKDFLLGNCLDLIRDVPDNSIDLIITDPPYGDPVLDRALKGGGKQVLMKEKDNLSFLELATCLTKLTPELFRVLRPGRHIYMFHAMANYGLVLNMLRDADFVISSNILIWNKKKNMSMAGGLNYMRSYEPILFGYKPAKDASDIRALATPCKDVLEYEPLSSQERSHAFEKPRLLLSFLIRQSSLEYEKILDPFAGVASTLRACRDLKRRAIGFELDKGHHAVGTQLLVEGK